MTQEEARSIVAQVKEQGDSRIEARAGYNPWPQRCINRRWGVALRLFPGTGRELCLFLSVAREWPEIREMWGMLLEEEDKGMQQLLHP